MDYSFAKGLGEVKTKDLEAVKKELQEALFIFNKTTWYQRLKGKREPKKSEFDTIEAIFHRYKITEIWGSI
jgi:hypothetical protein